MNIPVARREAMRAAVRRALNRPEDDDLFIFPDEYDAAIDTAARYYRRAAAQIHPDLFYEVALILPSEGDGTEYVLPQDHLGEIEVWAPPGPPNARRILPGLPESRELRFYQQGQVLRLTRANRFSPGLYIRWIPYEPGEDSPTIPAYFDRAIELRAAYELAMKPGYMGDANQFLARANREWGGDPSDPSDTGILGIITRQAVDQGYKAITDFDAPWWRRISSDV